MEERMNKCTLSLVGFRDGQMEDRMNKCTLSLVGFRDG